MTYRSETFKRTSTWSLRTLEILRHLETDAHDPYTRKEVEVLFQVSRASATRLMKRAGAAMCNGVAAAVSRVCLRIYVSTCPELAEARAAEERNLRIERVRTQKLASRRLTEMAMKYPVEGARFRDLPAVYIADGKLTIEFTDGHDCICKVWELSKAIANETDLFLKMCEPNSEATPKATASEYPR